MRRIVLSVVIVSLLVQLSACEHGRFKKADLGMLSGALGGAWLGSNVGKGKGNIVAIASGTLLGAYLGREIGASLDRADIAYYEQVSQSALETSKTGVTTQWQNPDTGTHGTITPVRTYPQGDTHCREYQQTIMVGGKQVDGYGTACRRPDGAWEIVQQ